MKKILVIIICLFISIVNVKANSINSIEMDVYIDDNGHAKVTEVWKSYLNQGTEGYRAFKLENEEITNFTVKDDKDVYYEYVQNWDTSLSFSDKAYKCGIHNTNNEVELCWGISEYGSRTYTLNYDINNFVTQYTDTQGIYFNFLDLDQPVGNAKITIHSNYNFSLENSSIWAFGYNGTINFENNTIVLNSNGTLSNSQYMVALVRFDSNIFNSSNKNEKSFNDVYNEAMNGVEIEEKTLYDEGEYINKDYMWIPIGLFIFIMVLLIVRIIMIVIPNADKPLTTKYKENLKNKYLSLKNSVDSQKQLVDDEIDYCREIPCDKNLFYAYWTLKEYNIISLDILKKGIIGAILLKWIKENKINVIETKTTILKSRKYAIDLNNISSIENEIEKDLLKILKNASGFNNTLDPEEFGRWCQKNYYKLDKWFDNIIIKETLRLKNEGLITTIEHENISSINTKYKDYIDINDNKLKEEAIKLIGLKKFLLDFSIIPEREYNEVVLWEEYLIFAHLLGIADKVEEQFKKLYPEFFETSKLDMNFTTKTIREMAARGCSSAEKGGKISKKFRDRYSGGGSDSGGGGSSFSSGGSSSSGSSGGGFR